jgi:mRNA interferase RelE/StbE
LGHRVTKSIDKLPNEIIEKIHKKIKKLKTDPKPPGVKKLKQMEGYRVRVGNYRILYTIDKQSKIITIYKIAHRKLTY